MGKDVKIFTAKTGKNHGHFAAENAKFAVNFW